MPQIVFEDSSLCGCGLTLPYIPGVNNGNVASKCSVPSTHRRGKMSVDRPQDIVLIKSRDQHLRSAVRDAGASSRVCSPPRAVAV